MELIEHIVHAHPMIRYWLLVAHITQSLPFVRQEAVYRNFVIAAVYYNDLAIILPEATQVNFISCKLDVSACVDNVDHHKPWPKFGNMCPRFWPRLIMIDVAHASEHVCLIQYALDKVFLPNRVWQQD